MNSVGSSSVKTYHAGSVSTKAKDLVIFGFPGGSNARKLSVLLLWLGCRLDGWVAFRTVWPTLVGKGAANTDVDDGAEGAVALGDEFLAFVFWYSGE